MWEKSARRARGDNFLWIMEAGLLGIMEDQGSRAVDKLSLWPIIGPNLINGLPKWKSHRDIIIVLFICLVHLLEVVQKCG